jgi:hypothetical protein
VSLGINLLTISIGFSSAVSTVILVVLLIIVAVEAIGVILSGNGGHEPVGLTRRLGHAGRDTGSHAGPIIMHTGRRRRSTTLLEVTVVRLDLFSLPFSGI